MTLQAALREGTTDPDGPLPRIFVDYFDGVTLIPRRVSLGFEGVFLAMTPPEGAPVRWHLANIRRVPDQAGSLAETGVALALSDGSAARLYIPPQHMGLANAIVLVSPAQAAPAPVPGLRGRLVALSVAALASIAAILFLLIPVMADQLAEYLPPDGEKALGDATFEQIRVALDNSGGNGLKICEAPKGQAALDQLTARLSQHAAFPFPLTVHVLDHEAINAFALPGGHITFFSGLIEAADSPEEVAAVLAHEMGHVAARDSTRGALRSAGSIGVLGLVFGDFAGGTLALLLAEQLIAAQYSQAAELTADAFALELLEKEGLPPEALGVFFQRLRDRYGDEDGLVAHFSTHPALRDRMQIAVERSRSATPLERKAALTQTEWQSLRRICG